MRLLFRQRMFSWLDSYDIYNESGDKIFTVKGIISFGHCLRIYDRNGEHVGTLSEKIFRFLPTFEMYVGDRLVGTVRKEFSLFNPVFELNCNGWHVEGDLFEWDYTISNANNGLVATVSKQIFKLTDTYVIDVWSDADILPALMVVLAIDAEKCSRR